MANSNDWLYVSSCAHIGENNARLDLFKQSLKKAKELRAGICLIGDLLDVGVHVGTAHAGSVYENSLNPDEQLDMAVEILEPYKDNIEIILPGNHEDRVRKAVGLKLNKQVAVGLGKRNVYRDTYEVIRYGGKNIFLAHGASPSDFNKVLLGHENIDIIALGHMHELSNKQHSRILYGGIGHAPQSRNIELIRCGTYLDQPRYGKMQLYPPNRLGGAWINIQADGEIFVDLGIKPRK